MCLITKNTEGCVSDRPKTCYKVYLRGDDGEFISYYVGMEYDLKEGDEVVAKGMGDVVYAVYVDADEEIVALGEGFIHALERKSQMLCISFDIITNRGLISNLVTNSSTINMADIDEALDIMKERLDSLYLCEMEIPAGERYWAGEAHFIVEGRALCARKMIFKREIKVEKKSEILELIFEYSYTEDKEPGVLARWKSLIKAYKEKEE